MAPQHPLQGLRVLIAEDNLFAAIDVEQTLEDLGCQPVGPVAKLEEALRLAREEMLDGALLDLNLRDESALPVADELIRRGVRVILTTGYDESSIPPRLAHLPRLRKPFIGPELERLMIATFRRA